MVASDVLVYTGQGVGPNLLRHVVAALTRWLGHRYDVKRVDARLLAQQPWAESTALLVMPGGRDTPYARHLAGAANLQIRRYVENGGSYLGLCAGAYYACRCVEFELGSLLQVNAPRELALFPGTGRGGVYPGFVYNSEEGARAVSVAVDTAQMVDLSQALVGVYYNGGCTFDPEGLEHVRTLARYTEGVGAGKPAIVECQVGRGTAILSGVHIEYEAKLASGPEGSTAAALLGDDPARRLLMRSTLRRLGLRTSDEAIENPPLTDVALIVQDLAPSDPAAAAVWETIVRCAFQPDGEPPRLETGDPDYTIALGPADGSPWRVSLLALQSVPNERLRTAFDSQLFFQHRRELGARQLGAALMYTDVITSTQTVLERNPAMLRALPDGLVCTAAHQVSGRGRGQNHWVSSAGCLQFSVALRHRDASTVVFVQYLMALAVVDAVRSKPGYKDIGMAIKWPNDIYSREIGADGAPVLRKIGGVLVNSSFYENIFNLIVGCGVNLNNSEPTDCVNDLIGRHNARYGTALDLLRKEELLARVLASFESLVGMMNEHGSFMPLLPLYYGYWLHSGQRVVLDSFGGAQAVIEGISAQGLLLTRSVRNPGELYEHQPDGNSFDLMKNMIVRKK